MIAAEALRPPLAADRQQPPAWHAQGTDAVLVAIAAADGGLSAPEARAGLGQHGRKELPPPPGRSVWLRCRPRFMPRTVPFDAASRWAILGPGLANFFAVESARALLRHFGVQGP